MTFDNRLIYDFLCDLVQKNNREWMADNKERYQQARAIFYDEVSYLLARIGEFDEDVKYLQPAECIYRLHRDLRFSPDKTPFKDHFGAYMCPFGGRKSLHAGYYLHISPNGSFVTGGLYMPEKSILKRIRESIEVNFDEFLDIIRQPDFAKVYGDVVSPEVLTRVPNGFAPDSPAAEYLKMKHIIAEHELLKADILALDFADQVVEYCRLLQPLNAFLNECVEN